MLNLALVTAAEWPHGKTFTGLFNGIFDPETGKPTQAADPRLRNARIIKIWDANRKAAQELADTRHIETVLDRYEDAAEDVDGVLIADDCSQELYKFAPHFIDRKIPLFVDKPLSRKYVEAKRVVDRAKKKGCLFQSGSSLRYCNEVLALKDSLKEKVGKPLMAATFGPNELIFYGVHSLELLLGVVEGRVATVQHLGTEKLDLVHLKFESGLIAMWMCGEGAARGGWRCVLRGTKGEQVIESATDGYTNMLARFVTMIETGKPPISLGDTLHVIAILDTAQKSVESGGKELKVPQPDKKKSKARQKK
ncbi:MAG: Gfo/Idh/MocA family oxidoreductase [Planctomycetes bacterium]|nr:Gfo/Idh/MocA family oxidoreductase [Planctomycetota bacterium]